MAGWGRRFGLVVLAVAVGSVGLAGVGWPDRLPVAGAVGVGPEIPVADAGVPASFPVGDAPGDPTAGRLTAPAMPASRVVAESEEATFRAGSGVVEFARLPLELKVAPGALVDGTVARIELLDPKEAEQVTESGVAFRVRFTEPGSKVEALPAGPIELKVDYSELIGDFGGDYRSRLGVVSVPECQLVSAATRSDCAAPIPLISMAHDTELGSVTVDISVSGEKLLDPALIGTEQDRRALLEKGLPQTTPAQARNRGPAASDTTGTLDAVVPVLDPALAAEVGASLSAASGPVSGFAGGASTFALTSSVGGDSGDFGATPLTAVGTGSVGLQSGSAEASYPVVVPPAPFGPTPKVEFQYSSASVDGMTTDKNTQGSDVGLGWQLEMGSITRAYKACNLPEAPGDLCWDGINYSISLNGMSERLIPTDFAATTFRFEHDNGWKATVVQTPLFGDHTYGGNGAEFHVFGPDGTEYRFGGLVDPKFPVDVTNSLYSVPVYHPGTGDPCYGSPGRVCMQGWKWNLDQVKDPSGGTILYRYTPQINAYNIRAGQGGPYTMTYQMGGSPYDIRYGMQFTNPGSTYLERVAFTTDGRCVNASPCSSLFNGTWPDTPWDLLCAQVAGCSKTSPSFWTSQRIKNITTQYIDNAAWRNVASYTVFHSYPDPGFPAAPFGPSTVGSSPKMTLDTIKREDPGNPVNLFALTNYGYTALPNRLNYPVGSGVSPLMTKRLTSVTNELGGKTTFTYGQQHPCAPETPFLHYETHPQVDCFLAWYGVGPFPSFIPFQKYYVVQSSLVDLASSGATQTTNYTYIGGPNWHYSNVSNLPEFTSVITSVPTAPANYWNEYRGFRQVDVSTAGEVSKHLYITGMDGDRDSVSNYWQFQGPVTFATWHSTTQQDVDELASLEVDSVVRNSANTVNVTRASTNYYSLQTFGPAIWGAAYRGQRAYFSAPSQVDSWTLGATPLQEKTARTSYTYTNNTGINSGACLCNYGLVDFEDHQGDISTPADNWHVDYFYNSNSSVWIRGLVGRKAVRTGSTPGSGTDVSKTEFAYDGGTVMGGIGSRGLVTKVRAYHGHLGLQRSDDRV